MFDVDVDSKEAARLTSTISRLPKRFTGEVEKAVKDAASDLARESRIVLRSSGRKKPAPPGRPPAVQTGLLARSITVRKGRKRRDDIVWRVVSEFYGRFQEVGADDRSKLTKQHASEINAHRRKGQRKAKARSGRGGQLLPRPWATIARRKQAPQYVQRVTEAISRVLDEFSA